MSLNLNQYDKSRGLSRAIVCSGDSLFTNVGGTLSIPVILGQLMPGRYVRADAIGGQTFQQIAARRGSSPALLTLSGNAFAGTAAVSVTALSVQPLSTPADNTTRTIAGTLAGVPCFLTRTASGGPPSTTETYTVTPAQTSAVAVPANTPFYPSELGNAAPFISILWWGRNNTPTFAGLTDAITAAVAAMATPRRFVLVGVLNGTNEGIGTANYNAIRAENALIQALAPDLFVDTTPPTTAEMAALSYTPTTQDNTDIANGCIPTGMRNVSDPLHPNNIGQMLMALRMQAVLGANNW